MSRLSPDSPSHANARLIAVWREGRVNFEPAITCDRNGLDVCLSPHQVEIAEAGRSSRLPQTDDDNRRRGQPRGRRVPGSLRCGLDSFAAAGAVKESVDTSVIGSDQFASSPAFVLVLVSASASGQFRQRTDSPVSATSPRTWDCRPNHRELRRSEPDCGLVPTVLETGQKRAACSRARIADATRRA